MDASLSRSKFLKQTSSERMEIPQESQSPNIPQPNSLTGNPLNQDLDVRRNPSSTDGMQLPKQRHLEYYCPKCSATFWALREVKEHLNSEHTSRKTSLQAKKLAMHSCPSSSTRASLHNEREYLRKKYTLFSLNSRSGFK